LGFAGPETLGQERSKGERIIDHTEKAKIELMEMRNQVETEKRKIEKTVETSIRFRGRPNANFAPGASFTGNVS